jgi:tetratricopeptide (TPR) repeat protein
MISEWFFKKLNVIGSVLAVVVLLGLVMYAANIEIKDLDLWLHLATGKHIVQTGQIPKVDILSGTIAGSPWINHEWLFQVIVFLLYDGLGLDGIISLQVILVSFIFILLLMMGCRERFQLVPILLLYCVFMVFQLRFTHRPDLFSLLFFVCYFYILAAQLDRKAALFSLFILQVLWNNIHGFFILGPVIVLIGLIGEWIKRHAALPFQWNQTGRLSNEEYTRLKYAFGVVLFACLLNPHFLEGALYPFRIFLSLSGESKVFFQHIGELQKPISWGTLFDWQRYFYFKLLIVLSFFSFVLNYKKIDLGLLLFWIMFLLFSLRASRNIVYFSIAAYFVVIGNMQAVSIPSLRVPAWLRDPKVQNFGSLVVKALLIVIMVNFGQQLSLRGYYDFDRNVRKAEYGGGISLRNFPYKAVDFLVDHDVEGTFFNDFNSGAYLLGRTYPQIKVFIDGRTEVYGEDYFETYRQAYGGDKEKLQRILSAYDLTGAFLGSVYAPAGKETLQYFYENDDWILVYFDYDAMIFLKDIPLNQRIIEQYATDLSQRRVRKADLTKLGVTRVTPYRYLNRAQVLFHLGFYDQAKQEARQAIRISPYNAEAFEIMGKVAMQEEDFPNALQYFRNAKLLGRNNVPVARKLAECFYRLGAYPQARKQCEKILRKREDPAAYFVLALINIQQGRGAKALQYARKVQELSSAPLDDLVEIGDLFFASNVFDKAKAVYAMALNADPDTDAASYLQDQLGKCENALE